MADSARERYYVFGGKGGVGKTSLAASLAMKFANQGEPTLIASMDRARSLGDTFGQDLSDGKIVPVNGVDSLFVAELGHYLGAKEDSSYLASAICNIVGKIGLGALADPLGNTKLFEMLLTIPGLAEGIAIEKLIDIIKLSESNKFRRVILDTSDTGHTLNLLSAVTLIEKCFSMANKVVRLPALKSAFEKSYMDPASMEELRKQIATVRDLIRDPKLTEFLIVTIPTVMAITESSRFHASLQKDGARVTRLIVNQVLSPSASECKFCAVKRKEETRALNMIRADRELGGLKLIQASQQDVEVKGVPALRFFSDVVRK
ncbi:unnamed protein product [Alopecurus aequalis]